MAVPVRAELGGTPAAGGRGRSCAGAPGAASPASAAAAAEEQERQQVMVVAAAGRGGCAWPAQRAKGPAGCGKRRAPPLLDLKGAP